MAKQVDVRRMVDMDEVCCRAFEDDELATKMAKHTLRMAFHRINRNCWLLRGWPARSVMLLVEDA